MRLLVAHRSAILRPKMPYAGLLAEIVGQPGRVRVCPAQDGTDVKRIAAPQASHHAIKAQIETDRPAPMKTPPGTGRPTQRPTHTPAQSGELCCQLDHTIRILPAFWIAHGRCSISGHAIQRVSRRLDNVAKCRAVWFSPGRESPSWAVLEPPTSRSRGCRRTSPRARNGQSGRRG